ncbi:MAG TPA: hypothetical protein VGG22_15155 [Candidatus Baltobacteraceae bacterium]|jgi:hypothetical protein
MPTFKTFFASISDTKDVAFRYNVVYEGIKDAVSGEVLAHIIMGA